MRQTLAGLALGLALILQAALEPAHAAAATFIASTADTDGTPNTSSAFTPTAGRLQVVFVQAAASIADACTLSNSLGGGTTYSMIRRADYGTNTHSLYLFVADQTSTASSQTITVTCTADDATGTVISIYEVSGMSLTGSSAVKQSDMDENRAAASTSQTVFGANALTGNPVLVAHAESQNPPAVTPPTNWTEDDDTGYNTPSMGLEVAHRDSGFTSTTITWGSACGAACAAIAVELDTSSSATDFTTGPTLTAIANGQRISATVGATATVYGVGCSPGDATPNQAELEAGQCGGGNTAVISCNKSFTGGAADTKDCTATNKPPRLDWYVGCSNGGGACTGGIDAFADQNRSADSGQKIVCPASISATSIFGSAAGLAYFNPDFAANDCLEADSATNENADCIVNWETDGDFELVDHSDGVNVTGETGDTGQDNQADCSGKRTFEISFEDTSSATNGLFSSPSSVGNFSTDDRIVINNHVPVLTNSEITYLITVKNEAMTSVDLNDKWDDPDGDAVTVTFDDALPTGLSSTAGVLSGTPTSCGVNAGITMRATDSEGDFQTVEVQIDVGSRVPDLRGMTQSEVEAALAPLC